MASEMIENNTIDDAVSLVTKTIIDEANDYIPRSKEFGMSRGAVYVVRCAPDIATSNGRWIEFNFRASLAVGERPHTLTFSLQPSYRGFCGVSGKSPNWILRSF
ncbi:hypothetical protein AVEN_24065-1 [Araneus ventricosus]|uniref:Uncharacterized protein n=1 Tax=Araneus ventricosus TaxID=182803 RepID=A0A4Y2NKX1_ARAVE|nr:hypothetical protein AVEN_24065-1 [Araneus ventricosus]